MGVRCVMTYFVDARYNMTYFWFFVKQFVLKLSCDFKRGLSGFTVLSAYNTLLRSNLFPGIVVVLFTDVPKFAFAFDSIRQHSNFVFKIFEIH